MKNWENIAKHGQDVTSDDRLGPQLVTVGFTGLALENGTCTGTLGNNVH